MISGATGAMAVVMVHLIQEGNHVGEALSNPISNLGLQWLFITLLFVGGIQILPQFQNKGIGSAIFNDLINEAKESQVSIKLEVAKVNKIAKHLYKKFGFVTIGEKGTDFIMEYRPNLISLGSSSLKGHEGD